MFPPKQSRLPTVLWPSPYVGRVQVLLVQVIIQWVGDSAVRCWFEVLLSRTKVKKGALQIDRNIINMYGYEGVPR